MSDAYRFDDRTWEQVWERLLGPHDRHRIASHVWHGDLPDEPFEGRVAIELAYRWRRRAIYQGVLWSLWVAYWWMWFRAELVYNTWPGPLLPLSLMLLGGAIVGFAVYARRRVADIARLRGRPLAADAMGALDAEDPRGSDAEDPPRSDAEAAPGSTAEDDPEDHAGGDDPGEHDPPQ